MTMSETVYTLVHQPASAVTYSAAEFKSQLERGSDAEKAVTMRALLVTMLNTDPMPELLMHVIRYVMPSKDKQLKTLLYFYWEACSKYGADGKLRHEMILVCNAIQRDLQHANEYVRGHTLRFLAKLREPELLETLVPNCRACLDHRHAYVRKNAIFAIYSIYKVSDHLIPDAPELIKDFLAVETDPTCKRNAFVCLSQLDRDACLLYIQESQIFQLDPLLQLAIIEFIRRDCLINTELINEYTQIMMALLEMDSTAVCYEAATTLSILNSSAECVQASAAKFIQLALKESDINVKLIALERISELHAENEGVLDEICLDVLKLLTSPSFDVRKKSIEIGLKLVSGKNVEDVTKLFKKELTKSTSSDEDNSDEYRQVLINAIHSCAIRFNEVAANVVDLLLDVLGDLQTKSAYAIVDFVKQVIDKFPNLRVHIIEKLIQGLKHSKSAKVHRTSLWILGEFALEEKTIQMVWRHIKLSIGELPILATEKNASISNEQKEDQEDGEKVAVSTKPRVLADGTYATETAYDDEQAAKDARDKSTSKGTLLRSFILSGEFYLATGLSSTLVKLIFRLNKISERKDLLNALKAEAMLIMVSILRVGESSLVKKKIDEGSADRIMSCIQFLSEDDGECTELLELAFLEDSLEAFKKQVVLEEQKQLSKSLANIASKTEQIDDSIQFRQFANKDAKIEAANSIEGEFTVSSPSSNNKESLSSRLKRIVQLTGFSDPVYVEAYVKVQKFDVVLDILIVNQTTETLKNLTLEFGSLGALKVVDKPTMANIGPHGFHKLQVTVKVNSATTGVIFGNVVYEGHHANDSTIVILADVKINILDYLKPVGCDESEFRTKWNEFEWENKIDVACDMPSLNAYLDKFTKCTNMKNLTAGALIGDCQFLSANFHTKSTFGESVLANMSIEQLEDGSIKGEVRVRSSSQGLALSLGDIILALGREELAKSAPV